MTDPGSARDPGLDCQQVRMSLGVLVLGAIEPEERPALETHLASCAACSAELAQLAVLPGLLQRLDPADADALDTATRPAPAALGDRLRSAGRDIAAQRRERAVQGRRRAVVVSVGAVAASVLVGLVVANGLPDRRSPEATAGTVVATATRPGSAVGARFVLRPRTTGTHLSVSVHGVGPNRRCSLVAVSTSGRREVAATWVASYAGAATVDGTTSLPIGDIARLQVVAADGTTLARTALLDHGRSPTRG